MNGNQIAPPGLWAPGPWLSTYPTYFRNDGGKKNPVYSIRVRKDVT